MSIPIIIFLLPLLSTILCFFCIILKDNNKAEIISSILVSIAAILSIFCYLEINSFIGTYKRSRVFGSSHVLGDWVHTIGIGNDTWKRSFANGIGLAFVFGWTWDDSWSIYRFCGIFNIHSFSSSGRCFWCVLT